MISHMTHVYYSTHVVVPATTTTISTTICTTICTTISSAAARQASPMDGVGIVIRAPQPIPGPEQRLQSAGVVVAVVEHGVW